MRGWEVHSCWCGRAFTSKVFLDRHQATDGGHHIALGMRLKTIEGVEIPCVGIVVDQDRRYALFADGDSAAIVDEGANEMMGACAKAEMLVEDFLSTIPSMEWVHGGREARDKLLHAFHVGAVLQDMVDAGVVTRTIRDGVVMYGDIAAQQTC